MIILIVTQFFINGKNIIIFSIIFVIFAFLLIIIYLFLQRKNIIMVSGEDIYLYPRYGRKKPKIINANQIKEYEYYRSNVISDSGPENHIIIKYGNNKVYRLGIYDYQDAEQIDKFFTQYLKKRNILADSY